MLKEYANRFQKSLDWVVDMFKKENRMDMVYKQVSNQKVLDFLIDNAEIKEK